MSLIGNNLIAANSPFGLAAGAQQALDSGSSVRQPLALGLGGDFVLPNAPVGSPSFAQTSGAQPFPWSDCGGGFGGVLGSFFGFISNLFGTIQQYMSQFFGAPPQSQLGQPPQSQPTQPQPQEFFKSADASSVGDPHDAFWGLRGSGGDVAGKWNNMQSHSDLLSSDSFAGGYQISTQVTTPNANGVTRNQSATVTTNDGKTSITVNADGRYTVTSNGRDVRLQAGKTVELGNGESVTLNEDGSVTVNDRNAQGGALSTTLQTKEGGVNVTSHANSVDLGGYLVNHGDDPAPPMQPYQPTQPLSQPPTVQPLSSWLRTDEIPLGERVDPILN